ncbi:MFS transporter [Fodinicola feengrottensis]|uniref:Multidrug efflux pump Tap n=1 Tax=Fodinicola feengrottensis TaxID=435914 RepID=A0ABP4S1S1_9ACTN
MTLAAGRVATTVPLRRNRQFRLLWIGQALSDFGSSMTSLAVPLALLAAGYSPSAAGIIGTAMLIVGLAVRVPAGYLADRWDQRRLMLGCDLARLVAVAAVAFCVFVWGLPLLVALGLVVVSITAQEIFQPSQSKIVRRAVPGEQLGTAVSLNQARAYGASIAAPAVAGPLMALWPWAPFTVDAFTFGVSALCVAMLARNRLVARTAEVRRERFLPQIAAGWRYLVKDRFLRWSSGYFALANVIFSAFGYALILGTARQAGGAAAAGVAVSFAGIAGLTGSLIAPYAKRRLPLSVVLAAGPTMSAVLLAIAWAGGGVIPFVAAFSALCLLTPVIGAVLATIMAKVVPEDIYGRVTASSSFLAQILQPCGPLAAGILLSQLSFGTTAGLFALAQGALAVLAFTIPTPAEPIGTSSGEGLG